MATKTPPNKTKKKEASPFTESTPPDRGYQAQIERVILSEQSPVDLDEIALEFYRQVGGAKGYVAKLMTQYKTSTGGSTENIRLLEMMSKIWAIHQQKHQATDLDIITNDDIQREAKLLMEKILPVGLSITGWIDHACI